jgi:hypothetical protein
LTLIKLLLILPRNISLCFLPPKTPQSVILSLHIVHFHALKNPKINILNRREFSSHFIMKEKYCLVYVFLRDKKNLKSEMIIIFLFEIHLNIVNCIFLSIMLRNQYFFVNLVVCPEDYKNCSLYVKLFIMLNNVYKYILTTSIY